MAPSCVLRPSRLLTQPGKHCSTPTVFWIFTCDRFVFSISIQYEHSCRRTSSRHRDSERSAAQLELLCRLARAAARQTHNQLRRSRHLPFLLWRWPRHPGNNPDLFPWPNARRGGRGTGQIEATAFAIAPASVGFWLGRLNENHVPAERAPLRFEQEVIRFADPDGMILELIASAPGREVEAWTASSVPAEHSLRGFHSVSAALEGYESSAKLLTEVFGYELVQEKGNRFRFAPPDMTGPARMIDLLCMPDTQHARGGAGTVHHIAFRTPNDASQRACREQLVKLGFNVSPVMDRTYFHSIYFREPGGSSLSGNRNPIRPGLQRTRQSRNSVTSCAFRHGWKTPARRSKKS